MNIIFTSLEIHNFQSIGEAILSLEDNGVTLVEGINNYEDNVKSNGSGKTSLFSALFWCLYGKTPEGILNVKNRYSNSACDVKLHFSVDGVGYTIIRSIDKKSQSVDIYIGDNLQSFRNKSDCDKAIRESILQMSPDIFLSLIYLNQGFSSRISSLIPSARKERLESLTNTSEIVDTLSEKISKSKNEVSVENSQLNSKYSSCEGSLSSYQSSSAILEDKLSKALNQKSWVEYKGKKYSFECSSALTSHLADVDAEISEISIKKSDLTTKKLSIRHEIDDILGKSKLLTQYIEETESKLVKLKEDEARCPTCNQILSSKEQKEALIMEYESKLTDWRDRLQIETEKLGIAQEKRDEVEKALSKDWGLEEKLALKEEYTSILKILPPPSNESEIEFIKQSIEENENNIAELLKEIDNLQQQKNESDMELEILSHLQALVTKKFRSHLLSTTIEFLNSRLLYYSSKLFSNSDDIIFIQADSQKLDILVGDSSYESLSGGEKRRVDLALMLSQRDLARELSGTRSNLLILDEIMESMDEEATNVMLNLLLAESGEDIRSLYIISHNNYSLPVDSRIVVCKQPNQISTVNIY